MQRSTVTLLILAVVLGALVGALGVPALAVLAPIFVAVLVVWPACGVVALIIACVLERTDYFAITVGGFNMRPDELAALALAAALIIRVVLTPRAARSKPAAAVAWQQTDSAMPGTRTGLAQWWGGRARLSGQSLSSGRRLSPQRRAFGGGLGGGISPGSPGGGGGGEGSNTPPIASRARGRIQYAPRPPSPERSRPWFAVRRQSQAPQGVRANIPLLLPLLAYLGANILATATSGNFTRGLSLDLITLDLMILYVVLVWFLSTPERLLKAIWLWLGIAVVEAVLGVLAFAAYLSVHTAVPGVQLDLANHNNPLVYATLYEGNIYGSYMSATFLIALALATEETARRRGLLYLVCVATAIGIVLSGTRSAWGATAIGAVVLLALLRLGRIGRRGRLMMRLFGGLIAVGAVLAVGLAVLPPSITGAFGARAQGLLNFGSGSGYGRLLLLQEAIAEWRAHPLLGLGPGSFNYRLPGDFSTGPAWLPNLTIQALHDTGVLGLLALVWLFIAFYVVTIRALRRAAPGEQRAALAGLIAAVTALLIAFQLTTGFTLGYSWALLAFGIAAARTMTAVAGQGSRGQDGQETIAA